ncbi:regulator-ty1 transposition protein [Colletotrichum incanum]|nr:regulator-ty1 transposition protein [Colletotrichum incanum]
MTNLAQARRRERGVIAQREYRKRHASKVQKLQDENQRLKNIIAEICRASRKCNDLPDDLKAAVRDARDLAGIADALATADDNVGDKHAEQTAFSSPERPSQTPPTTSVTRPLLEFRFPPNDQTPGWLSPRLDYGLWFDADRLVRVIDPPLDIVPYLGAGMQTIAGCIFWSTMNYTIDLWNSRSAPPATRHLDRVFNHSRHLTDRQYLMSLAQARIDYKKKGYMFHKLSEQFQRNAMSNLYKLVKDDYENKGLPSKYWKTPEEVAGNALSHMTPEQAARFQAVAEGKGTRADKEMMRTMVTWLVENFVCFGDGPRWSNISISIGIGSWITELKNADARARDVSPSSTQTAS